MYTSAIAGEAMRSATKTNNRFFMKHLPFSYVLLKFPTRQHIPRALLVSKPERLTSQNDMAGINNNIATRAFGPPEYTHVFVNK
jgi:hypothetical protein